MILQRPAHDRAAALTPESYASIDQTEARARDAYTDYIYDVGGITGSTRVGNQYRARVVRADELEADLLQHVPNGGLYYLEELMGNDMLRTVAYNLDGNQGVQRHVSTAPGEPAKYYPGGREMGRHLGAPLLSEIFMPGTYPELTELAARQEFLDPASLPARVMTERDHARTRAQACLGGFTVQHFGDLLVLYGDVAYPGNQPQPMRAVDQVAMHSRLMQGERLNLRRGTERLEYAKQELWPTARGEQLATGMLLNYAIPLGAVELYFGEDIDMAVAYGVQAAAYFVDQDIAV